MSWSLENVRIPRGRIEGTISGTMPREREICICGGEERNKRDKAVSISRGHQNCITSHLSPFFPRAIDDRLTSGPKILFVHSRKDTFRPVDLTVIYRGENEKRKRKRGGGGSIGVMEETLKRDRYFAKTNGRREIPLRYRSFLSSLRLFLRLLFSISRLIKHKLYGLLETG